VKSEQDGVLEFLLINHPLDCPVCDRGGECPLQDQTLAFGPGESRFVEEKRHFEKPCPISDLVLLDRERCIQCGRCTRFAAEIAGDPLIDFVERGDHTQVITFPDEPFASYFSGNTVQICPVGALTASRTASGPGRGTSRRSRRRARRARSVPRRAASRRRTARALLGVDSEPVNQGWLCDKGRYGYEWVHSDERVRAPMVRKNGELVEVSWPEALDAAAAACARARRARPGRSRARRRARHQRGRLRVGAPRQGVLGTDNVDAQLGDGLPARGPCSGCPAPPSPTATARAPSCCSVPTSRRSWPVLHLRVRRAARRARRRSSTSRRRHGLTRHATGLRHAPRRRAASVVDASRSVLAGCAGPRRGRSSSSWAAVAAESPTPPCTRPAGARAAGDVRFRRAAPRQRARRARPRLTPGSSRARSRSTPAATRSRRWGSVPAQRARRGRDPRGRGRGTIEALVVLGADPSATSPTASLRARLDARRSSSRSARSRRRRERADVFLPTLVWGRSRHVTNLEGRVQRVGRKVTPEGSRWTTGGSRGARGPLGADFGLETSTTCRTRSRASRPRSRASTPRCCAGRRDGVGACRSPSTPTRSWSRSPGVAADDGPGLVVGPDRSRRAAPARTDAGRRRRPDEVADAAVDRAPLAARPSCTLGRAVEPGDPPDAYALRLVAAARSTTRTRVVGGRRSRAARRTALVVTPATCAASACADGDDVRVTQPRGTVSSPCSPIRDPAGRGCDRVHAEGRRSADARSTRDAVTELRVETVA
jgi:NADH-quinone oxidoreductase subunit G